MQHERSMGGVGSTRWRKHVARKTVLDVPALPIAWPVPVVDARKIARAEQMLVAPAYQQLDLELEVAA